MTTPRTNDTVPTPLPTAVRTALAELASQVEHIATRVERLLGARVDLPTTGGHHAAATPVTLRAVGATRAALTKPDQRTRHSPVAPHAHDLTRHVTLKHALGDTEGALTTGSPSPDTTVLREALSTLAAIALAWLDDLDGLFTPPDDEKY